MHKLKTQNLCVRVSRKNSTSKFVNASLHQGPWEESRYILVVRWKWLRRWQARSRNMSVSSQNLVSVSIYSLQFINLSREGGSGVSNNWCPRLSCRAPGDPVCPLNGSALISLKFNSPFTLGIHLYFHLQPLSRLPRSVRTSALGSTWPTTVLRRWSSRKLVRGWPVSVSGRLWRATIQVCSSAEPPSWKMAVSKTSYRPEL